MIKDPIKYVQLQPDGELPSLADLSPYKAVLVLDQPVPEMNRWEISRRLVESGCRYLMAWGEDCASWEESVEDANLEAFNYEDIPDASVVMTTAHEDEPLEEVFWFCRHKAHHPSVELVNCVILHVSSVDKRIDLVKAYNDA